MKLINIYDNVFVRMDKATKGHKYIKRITKPSGKGFIYFYNQQQIKDYKKTGKTPAKEGKPTNEGGLLSGIMSFFGFKDEKQAQAKVKEQYNANKKELSGVGIESFTDYMNEYLSNKDKWDKKFQKKEVVTMDKKTGKVERKKATDKKTTVPGIAGKKWNMSLMKKIAGIVDTSTKTPEKETIDKYKKKYKDLSPKELKEQLEQSKRYNEIEKIAAIESLMGGREDKPGDKNPVMSQEDKKLHEKSKGLSEKISEMTQSTIDYQEFFATSIGMTMDKIRKITKKDPKKKKEFDKKYKEFHDKNKGKIPGDKSADMSQESEKSLRKEVENLSKETVNLAKEDRNPKTGEMSQKYYDTLKKLKEAKSNLNSFLDEERIKKLNSPEYKEQEKKNKEARILKEKVKQKERDVTSTTYERAKKRAEGQVDKLIGDRGKGLVSEKPKKEASAPDKSTQAKYDDLKKQVEGINSSTKDIEYYKDYDMSINKDGKIVVDDDEFNTAEEAIRDISGLDKKEQDESDKKAYKILNDAEKAYKKMQSLKEKLLGPKMFKAIKINGKYYRLEKGKKVPIGTVSKGQKKVAEGKWVPVTDGKPGAGKPDEKKKSEKKGEKPVKGANDKDSMKETIKTTLKKMANILTEALSAKESVQPTGQAVEDVGEGVKPKPKEKKSEQKKPEPKKEKPDSESKLTDDKIKGIEKGLDKKIDKLEKQSKKDRGKMMEEIQGDYKKELKEKSKKIIKKDGKTFVKKSPVKKDESK